MSGSNMGTHAELACVDDWELLVTAHVRIEPLCRSVTDRPMAGSR